jgi:hypothetical protein
MASVAQIDEEITEINIPHQLPDWRHQHVLDKRTDDLAECRTERQPAAAVLQPLTNNK